MTDIQILRDIAAELVPSAADELAQSLYTLLDASDVSSFEDAVRSGGNPCPAIERLLLPAFRFLIGGDEVPWRKIEEELRPNLDRFNLPGSVVREYFFDMDSTPYMMLRRRYGRHVPLGEFSSFIRAAQGAIFSVLQEYLRDRYRRKARELQATR